MNPPRPSESFSLRLDLWDFLRLGTPSSVCYKECDSRFEQTIFTTTNAIHALRRRILTTTKAIHALRQRIFTTTNAIHALRQRNLTTTKAEEEDPHYDECDSRFEAEDYECDSRFEAEDSH